MVGVSLRETNPHAEREVYHQRAGSGDPRPTVSGVRRPAPNGMVGVSLRETNPHAERL
jgi:hypothetical protein